MGIQSFFTFDVCTNACKNTSMLLCHGATMDKNCKDVEIFNLTKNIWKLSAHKSTIKVLVVIEKLKHFGVRITDLGQMKALHTN